MERMLFFLISWIADIHAVHRASIAHRASRIAHHAMQCMDCAHSYYYLAQLAAGSWRHRP
jgi:hypothetical protein